MARVFESAAILASVAVLVSFTEGARLPWAMERAGAWAGASQSNRVLAFIVNKASPLDNLSSQDLRKIFLGERSKWPDGHKVTLVMQERGQEERAVFLRLVCHMQESDYNRYVLQAVFTGSVQAGPRLLSSASGVIKFVSLVPGAIGYVYADETDDSVKVLKIDGVGPDGAGYKFALEAPKGGR